MKRDHAYIERMAEPLASDGVLSANELLQLSFPDRQVELVRGRLVVREPPGLRHGFVAARLARLLANHVADHDLGIVVASETGFRLSSDPDTVRAADAAFIRRDRVPDPLPYGYAALAPDLVAEVLSPGDRPGEVMNKVGDWLNAGCRLVWVIDPARRRALVYCADGSVSLLAEQDRLDGEDVLPGFSSALGDVL